METLGESTDVSRYPTSVALILGLWMHSTRGISGIGTFCLVVQHFFDNDGQISFGKRFLNKVNVII